MNAPVTRLAPIEERKAAAARWFSTFCDNLSVLATHAKASPTLACPVSYPKKSGRISRAWWSVVRIAASIWPPAASK